MSEFKSWLLAELPIKAFLLSFKNWPNFHQLCGCGKLVNQKLKCAHQILDVKRMSGSISVKVPITVQIQVQTNLE